MLPIYVCSPYRGNIPRNVAYAKAACADAFGRNEAPFAPHLLYPIHDILDDDNPEERRKGLQAGMRYIPLIGRLAVYEDFNVSEGMLSEIVYARTCGIQIFYRRLSPQVLDRIEKECFNYGQKVAQ